MKKNLLLLGLCLSLSGISTSCAHGPQVQACVVDSKKKNFDCEGSSGEEITLPFSKGQELYCFSPDSFELFMKACGRGLILKLPTCRYSPLGKFTCTDGVAHEFDLEIEKVDNYICVNQRDRNRIQERCKS